MAEGVGTFRVGEKPTKILKHHDLESDPVGVVRSARFVPTIPEELQDNPDIQSLMSSSAPMKDQLKAARNLMRAGITEKEEWRGLGYIELYADIYDKETIEQVRDGRFDAVSTHFRSPGAAHCLICGQNWAADGFCEHDMGEMYEDDAEDGHKFPALAIPGVHQYLETSFVALEGDTLVAVQIMDEANADNNKVVTVLNKQEEVFDILTDTVFEFKDYHNKEDDMAKSAKDEIVLSDAEKKVFETLKKLRKEAEEKVLADFAQKIAALKGDAEFFPFQEEAELDEETAIQYALEDLETADQKVNADEVADNMQVELKAMLDEGLITQEEFDAADARLTAKQRKGLAGSTFCGPDRSFPVPDCAHVTAARRLIGRYKGPGDKSRILACVARKAKALGCGGSKNNDSADSAPDTSPADSNTSPCAEDQLKDLNNEDLRTLFHSAELELISRDLKVQRDCSDCAVHQEKAETAEAAATEAKQELESLQDTLQVLRGELQRAYEDYRAQVDSYVELGASLYKARADNLALVGVLNGKFEDIEKAQEALKDADLDKQEAAITDGFDLQVIVNKLNDGMSREPDGSVDNPTVNTDKNNTQLPEGLSAPAVEAINNIKELIADGQISDAQKIYDRMKALDMFTDELTFESLSAESDSAAE
jgi:hypothetical protein